MVLLCGALFGVGGLNMGETKGIPPFLGGVLSLEPKLDRVPKPEMSILDPAA